MPADSPLLQKLRALIIHEGTPATERQAALGRFERLLNRHDGPSVITTQITRSAKIGRQRRALPVDERARLEAYTEALSFGESIAMIVRACGPHGCLPMQIDFGCHAGDKPVIAVSFPREEAPSAVDFAAAVTTVMPEGQVNLANRSGPDERLFLVYPPGRVGEIGRAA